MSLVAAVMVKAAIEIDLHTALGAFYCYQWRVTYMVFGHAIKAPKHHGEYSHRIDAVLVLYRLNVRVMITMSTEGCKTVG